MKVVFRSPGPWHGRADLNARGVIAWEGFGGLPGSVSGGADEEIFVYEPSLRQVVQLTDDDTYDVWPTVTGAGRVYWFGSGASPGSTGPDWDEEIFQAVPNDDADGDGFQDAVDVCALRSDPLQADEGGVGSSSPSDGIGNACQCGDVSDDGIVDSADLDAYRSALAEGTTAGLAAPGKCRVNGAWSACSIRDVAILERALDSSGPFGPGISQTCDASLQF
jgi:hypothetical protein